MLLVWLQGVLKNQTRALVLKSLAFQRKNLCMNCSILTAPILVSLLLFGLQVAINSSLDTADNKVRTCLSVSSVSCARCNVFYKQMMQL